MWCKISLFGLMFGDLLQVCRAFTPVDGWNPAPVERYSLVELRMLLARVYTSQEVQDSAINTVSWEIKRNTKAQYEVNVKRTNSQRKIKCCTNDFYFAAEMPKYLRKGSRNMLWIMHLQKSHNYLDWSLHKAHTLSQRVIEASWHTSGLLLWYCVL